MRIAPLNINRPAVDDGTVDQAQGAALQKSLPAATQAETAKAEAAKPLPRAGGQWDLQLNEQLAKGQQALAYLDQLETRLQGLKSDLAVRLSREQGSDDAELNGKLRDVANLWQQRQNAAGGHLDGRLQYNAATPARQQFKIRGLDSNTLQSGDKETLAFSVGGIGQRLLVAAVDPKLSEAALARRFDQALAPADIRVTPDKAGGLNFSVPEAAWPTVRDTLAVKGSGGRFPSGQLTRVRTDAEADAIRPGNWQTGNPEVLRRSLAEVIDALARIRQARDMIH
ncbi:MAG TPA: hypothetical protein VF096_15250, partial [Azonexus sp.]